MKKILTLILVVLLSFSGMTVIAQNDNMSTENIQLILSQLGVMNGYPDGNFYSEKPVTRAEFAKIAVMASAYRDYVASGMNTSPFADVPFTHWAAPYVKLASVNKFITGYPDSSFRPDNNVLMEEAVTVVVKLLGYNDTDFAASWPYGQIGIARNTGLLDNISALQGDYLTRGDVAQLIYNTLRAKPKNSQSNSEYISTIGFNLKENVTVLATSKEDSSVGSGRVSTSNGTYKINQYFDRSIIGSKGYILVSNSDELLLFIGNNLRTVNYNVYTVLENEIVAYKDGSLVSLKLSDNLTAYHKLQTTTLGAIKKSLNTGYLLSVAYDSSGNAEYVNVNDNELSGPLTVLSDSFYKTLGLSDNPVVMRDGNKSALSSISKYDIVYYSPALDMIWAYSKKVTGTYEEAYPSRDSVSSVKIGGTTYSIESAQAAAALSSTGDFTLGDTVTVMIGKDGNIAGVISPENVSNNIYGYVTGAGRTEFTDGDGNKTSSNYVQVVHADGSTVKYKTKTDYSTFLHSVVKLTLSNGIATIKRENVGTAVKGEVDADKMILGNYELSENIKILDVITIEPSQPTAYTTVFAKKLDGKTIKSNQVLHYLKDSRGRITELILHNVTGDAYEYGIIISASINASGTGGSYSGYIGTQSLNVSSQNSKYSVTAGQPVQVIRGGSGVSYMTPLAQVSGNIESVSAAYVQTSTKTYKISDDCVVYGPSYNVMTITDALNNSSLKYQAYIDKQSSTVRVIKALNK